MLADLCRRFLDRDLPKTWDISQLSPEVQQALLQAVQQELAHLGFVPEFYAGIRKTLSRGYTLYQKGINLLTNSGLYEISELSPLIRTLTQPLQRSWLIYPREVQPEVLIHSC